MNSLTIKVYIASGYNANKGKLILNNVEYPFDNVMPDSDNAFELFFGFVNPITLPVTGQLFITDASDDVVPFDHNGTIQVNQGYGIWNYDYNNPCYMEFELEQDGQSYGDPSIEFGSVSNPWYYNQYQVSTCNTPTAPYSVEIITSGQGTVDGIHSGDQTGQYYLTAIPAQGWVFDHWSIAGLDTQDNPLDSSFPDAHQTVYVYFVQEGPQPETYTVSVNVTGQGTVSGAGTYEEGTSTTLTPTPASGWGFDHWHDNDNNQDYYSNPLVFQVQRDWDITAIFIEGAPSQPDLTGRYYFDSTNNYVIYFTNNQSLVYGPCGEGTSYLFDWRYTDHWILQVIIGGNYENFNYYENDDVFEYNWAEFTYSSTDPCGGPTPPQPTEKHIYLCDNSGAHLAEMSNTGSTWSVSGAFTSGMYSIRATVEGEYDDAWFKFYQTSGDNRVFVGAGDDSEFEDIGTYIVIDDILTNFSLVEDQTTNYYVVSYENTSAITTSMVETIVNNYTTEQGFVTGSDIAAMSYITMTDVQNLEYLTQSDISSMSYITMTDVQSLGYIDQTTLDSMSYVDSTSLSNMSYVNNSYLSAYMNTVVGDISAILQTI